MTDFYYFRGFQKKTYFEKIEVGTEKAKKKCVSTLDDFRLSVQK